MWSGFLRLTQRRILLHGGDELLRRCNRAKLPLKPPNCTRVLARKNGDARTDASEFQRTWLRGSRPISRSGGRACGPGGRRRCRNPLSGTTPACRLRNLGAPTDVLWMRLSRHANDPELLNSRLVGFRQLSGFFEERRQASADK
jgi:hypothetical protein